MANEVQMQFQLRLNNGELTDIYNTSSLQVDQSLARLVRNVQNVGAAEELLDTGDIVTPGFAVFASLADPDVATNYIEVGSYVGALFYPFLRLNPGEQSGPLRLAIATTELYAKSSAGTTELFYIIYND